MSTREEIKKVKRLKVKKDNIVLRRLLAQETFLKMGIDEETIKQTALMKLSDEQMNKIKFA